MASPTRDVFLVIYHSPVFPAHWSIWIPSTSNPDVGKIVNVIGDTATTFEHEFKRNYSIVDNLPKHSFVLLDTVDAKHIVDAPGDGMESSDKNAVDDIERKALSIPAPVKSLVPPGSRADRKMVEIKNCQTWLRQLVEGLVDEGILRRVALTRLDSAAKN